MLFSKYVMANINIYHYTTNKFGILIYLTIIPRGRVGYEMIESQRGA